VGHWKHQVAQGVHPSPEQGTLVFARCAIRVVGGKRLFRENVQASERAEGFIEIEVINVTTPFLVKEFEHQQGQERTGGRNHLRAEIIRVSSHTVELQFDQERQEQEDSGVSHLQRPTGFKIQLSLIGNTRPNDS
jgi:hypothetical protein